MAKAGQILAMFGPEHADYFALAWIWPNRGQFLATISPEAVHNEPKKTARSHGYRTDVSSALWRDEQRSPKGDEQCSLKGFNPHWDLRRWI